MVVVVVVGRIAAVRTAVAGQFPGVVSGGARGSDFAVLFRAFGIFVKRTGFGFAFNVAAVFGQCAVVAAVGGLAAFVCVVEIF